MENSPTAPGSCFASHFEARIFADDSMSASSGLVDHVSHEDLINQHLSSEFSKNSKLTLAVLQVSKQ